MKWNNQKREKHRESVQFLLVPSGVEDVFDGSIGNDAMIALNLKKTIIKFQKSKQIQTKGEETLKNHEIKLVNP